MQNQNTQSLIQKVKSKAEDFLKQFKLEVRPSNQTEFYTLAENADPDLRILVREAHRDFLPDDFRYEQIVNALAALADLEGEDLDEVSLEPDVYNSDLLKWLSSSYDRVVYCDQAVEEFGLEKVELMTIITYGQQQELDEIVSLVRESLISFCQDEDDFEDWD